MRELFRCALTMLLVEDGKGEIVEQHTIDGCEHLTLRTATCDSFAIVKPLVGERLLANKGDPIRLRT